MSHSNCERCNTLPPTIKYGPWAGQHHELRYCVYCSRDLCDKCLMEGKCRETPHDDKRHRIEQDCGACEGATVDKTGDQCKHCDKDGTVYVIVEGERP